MIKWKPDTMPSSISPGGETHRDPEWAAIEAIREIAQQLNQLNGNIERVSRNDGVGDSEGNFWIRTGD